MADGGFGKDDIAEFVYRFPGQLRDYLGRVCGACVPDGENHSDALVTEKYFTVLLRFTNAAGVLTLATGEKVVQGLTKGVGESATDAGFASGNLTAADTNAFSEGALVTTGRRFQLISVGCEILDPWIYNAGALTRNPAVWLDGYRERLQRAVMRDVTFRIKPAESKNEYDMGPIGHYPCHTAPGSTSNWAAIGAPLPNAPKPLKAMLVSGSKIESQRIVFYIDVARSAIIPAQSDPAADDVVVPIKFHLLGRSVRGYASEDDQPAGDSRVAALEAKFDRLVSAVEARLK